MLYHLDENTDKLKEDCGVFGIWGIDNASKYTALGLHALQHRGQEACGMATKEKKKFYNYRATGLVKDSLLKQDVLGKLIGNSAIGHNRYSTVKRDSRYKGLNNIQPMFAVLEVGGVSIAHNGNFVNAKEIRERLIKDGAIFQSDVDTENVLQLMAHGSGTVRERLIQALDVMKGGYSILMLSEDSLIGVRDPIGIRPLVIGKLNGAHILTSETVALDLIGAEFVREVEAGEMVIINDEGIKSEQIHPKVKSKPCIFEFVYFSHPNSILNGNNIYLARKKAGIELAKEKPVKAEIIVPVPDSGTAAAIGFSEYSKIPFEQGLIKNRYIGRSFIQPSDLDREKTIMLKHNINKSTVEGKRVVLVDDSIVRGTTSKKIIKLVRDAGAKEVHLRVASPQVKYPCFYGIDIEKSEEMLANKCNVENDMDCVGADSVGYISIDGLYRALGEKNGRDKNNPTYTDHFFTGDYPIPPKEETVVKIVDKIKFPI